MMFGFVAKHRGIWPVALICEALGVSRSGFYAWLTREPSDRTRRDDVLTREVRKSFLDSDRTYGARRVWHDVLAAGLSLRPARHRALDAAQCLESAAETAPVARRYRRSVR